MPYYQYIVTWAGIMLIWGHDTSVRLDRTIIISPPLRPVTHDMAEMLLKLLKLDNRHTTIQLYFFNICISDIRVCSGQVSGVLY